MQFVEIAIIQTLSAITCANGSACDETSNPSVEALTSYPVVLFCLPSSTSFRSIAFDDDP